MTLEQVRKVAACVEPFEFEHFGAAQVQVGEADVAVEALVRWTPEDGGVARFADPSLTLNFAMGVLTPNTIVPEEQRVRMTGYRYDDRSDWTLDDGMWTSKHNRLDSVRGHRDEFEVRFGELRWSREGDPCWQIVIVQGFNSAIFGTPTNGDLRAFDFRAFGRDGALVVLERADALSAPYAALIFAGGTPLSDDQVGGALSLLSLVGGRIVRLAAIAQHTFDGSAVSRTVYPHESDPRRALPPFRLIYPRDGVRYLQQEFGPMLDALASLRGEPPVEIEVAVTHLLAQPAFLDTEIRDLTLALDTLIESKAFKPRNVRPHLPPERFDEASRPLLDAFADVLSPDAMIRARDVLRQLNLPHHGQRREAFWRKVGFAPTERELAALRHRHPLSHSGFLQWAQSGRDEDVQHLHDDIAVLRTLVNRCIFALLGWRHPLMNHATFLDEPMPGPVAEAVPAE